MSLYLAFLFRRANAPVPKRVRFLLTGNDWADLQIREEFEQLFPEAELTGTASLENAEADLYVLPYFKDFEAELPGGVAVYRGWRANPRSWVVLYGLHLRQIEVLRADRLYRYHCFRKTVTQVHKKLRGTGLLRGVKTALRLWVGRTS